MGRERQKAHVSGPCAAGCYGHVARCRTRAGSVLWRCSWHRQAAVPAASTISAFDVSVAGGGPDDVNHFVSVPVQLSEASAGQCHGQLGDRARDGSSRRAGGRSLIRRLLHRQRASVLRPRGNIEDHRGPDRRRRRCGGRRDVLRRAIVAGQCHDSPRVPRRSRSSTTTFPRHLSRARSTSFLRAAVGSASQSSAVEAASRSSSASRLRSTTSSTSTRSRARSRCSSWPVRHSSTAAAST